MSEREKLGKTSETHVCHVAHDVEHLRPAPVIAPRPLLDELGRLLGVKVAQGGLPTVREQRGFHDLPVAVVLLVVVERDEETANRELA